MEINELIHEQKRLSLAFHTSSFLYSLALSLSFIVSRHHLPYLPLGKLLHTYQDWRRREQIQITFHLLHDKNVVSLSSLHLYSEMGVMLFASTCK